MPRSFCPKRKGGFDSPTLHSADLQCPSMVRGLVDGISRSQNTDVGTILEAADGRNIEGSLRPKQPLDSPSCSDTFSIPQSLPTPHCRVLCLEVQSGFARLSFTFPLTPQFQAPGPFTKILLLDFPSHFHWRDHQTWLFRSLALLLCGCGKTNDPVSLPVKQEQQSLAPWNCFAEYMKP